MAGAGPAAARRGAAPPASAPRAWRSCSAGGCARACRRRGTGERASPPPGAPAGLGPRELMAVKLGRGASRGGCSALLLGAARAGPARARCSSRSAPAAGFLAPDCGCAPRRGQRRAPMRRELPALLDLLRVTVEAGLLARARRWARWASGPAGRWLRSGARWACEAQLGVPLRRGRCDGLERAAAAAGGARARGRAGARRPPRRAAGGDAGGPGARRAAARAGARSRRSAARAGAEDPARGGAAARAVGAAARRRGARCRAARGRRTRASSCKNRCSSAPEAATGLAESIPARARPQVGPTWTHPRDWAGFRFQSGNAGVRGGPPWAIWTAGWRYVLQSGRKWGTVLASRTGVAGLLPLRHLGPRLFPGTCRHWPSAATSSYSLDAKNRLNVPAKFRAAFSSGVVLAKALEPCVAIWTPGGLRGVHRAASSAT